MKRCYAILIVWSLLAVVQAGSGAEWYVGPDGDPTNPGTREEPWDIASALDGKRGVCAGDTVYLLEGTYRRRPKELFEVRLAGTAEKPIHIRPAAGGRVRIDGGLSVQEPSAHLWIRDLEIFVSEALPDKPVSAGSHPDDLKRPWGGLHMYGGKNCKYINLLIHDCNQGISCWKAEINPEIYGCIIYDNGWKGTDRGHGHCIYTQNDEGVKVISNCIMSCRYDGTYTMHAYGSERAYVNNYLVEKNICYGKGPFLIGGGRPSHGIRVFGNYLDGVDMRIGYNAPFNKDCEVRDNVIVNGELNISRYRSVTRDGNLVVQRGQQRPAGAQTVLLASKYDGDRAHVAVYNWDKLATVEVNAGPFLRDGDKFVLRDPKNFFGEPVSRGVCRAGVIEVPAEEEFVVFVALRGR